MGADYPRLEISSAVELRGWLIANHQISQGIWLVTYKKAASNRHVPYEQIVREALCFGWIDGQAKPLEPPDRSGCSRRVSRGANGRDRTKRGSLN